MRDISTMDIRWSPVPQEHMNGIILGYKLTYQTTEQSVDNKPVFTKTINLAVKTTNFTIQNLNSSTSYVLELLAYTSKGEGVATKLTGGLNINY
jgi:hypothetical protein